MEIIDGEDVAGGSYETRSGDSGQRFECARGFGNFRKFVTDGNPRGHGARRTPFFRPKACRISNENSLTKL